MAGKRPKKLSPKEKRKRDIRLIVQSNELVEARYMFDTWEMRFFFFFASMIRKDDEDDKTYRIWLKDIKKTYKLNNNDSYHQLREASKRLSDKSVFLNYEKDGTVREVKHRFIRFVDYAKEGQQVIDSQEYVDVSIDKEMLPFLLHVKKNFDPLVTRYTSYDFRNIIDLKPYSARIYQLLKKEEYRKEITIVIDELKKQFNIVDEYKRFSTFYQRVIQPSLESINEHTDITVPLDKIAKVKRGRKTYAIRFPIYSKTLEEVSKLRNEFVEENDFKDVIAVEPEIEKTDADILFEEFEDIIVKEWGVTPSIFMRILISGKYGRENIEQAIAVTRRAKYNGEIKKTVAAFFIGALKDGYTDEKVEKAKKAKKHAYKKQLIAELDAEFADRRQEIINAICTSEHDAIEKVLTHIKSDNFKFTTELRKQVGKLELELASLSLQDFKDNRKVLMNYFYKGVEEKYNPHFEDLLKEYRLKRSKIK